MSVRVSRWQGVLFDLDGTLLDTAPDFIAVLNAMLVDRDREPLPYNTIRAVVSNGSNALVELAFGGTPGEATFDALAVELRDRYLQHIAVHTRLFPGLDDILCALEKQGVPWGIVTNKPTRYTAPLLDALALTARCSSVVCPDDVTRTKPDPEPILLACRQIGRAPAQCVYVGDHERDIAAGRNAAMQTVVAGWGYIGEKENPQRWGADFITNSVDEFSALLFDASSRHRNLA